jgi:hypothetical protein
VETSVNAQTHWYRSGYVWLVLAPLLVTVVGFFYTMYLLFASGNIDQLPGLGSKLGKIYTDQVSVPIEVRLQAEQSLTASADYRAQLLLTLPTTVTTAAGDRVQPGDVLELNILHPTLSNHDRKLKLKRSLGDHVVQLQQPLPERGVLWLRDPASDWQQVLPYQLRDGKLVRDVDGG